MIDLLLFTSQEFPFISSLFIVLLTVIIAWIVNWIFAHVLRRLAGSTKTQLDDALIKNLQQPVFWSTMLVGLYISFALLDLPQHTYEYIQKILWTVGLLIWGVASLPTTRLIFTELEQKLEGYDKDGMLNDFLPFLDKLVKLVIGVLILFGLLSIWGINITPLLASAGVAGVAVAFAAKDTVANIFGGASVFIDKPYKTGDYVIIKDKYRGEVIEIGLRSTRIRTRDNVLLTVPNSVLVTDAVVNETGFDPKLRIRIPLEVAYGTDLDKAEKLLVDVARKNKKILSDPAPRARYREFCESGIRVELMGLIAKPAERGRIIHQLMKDIHRRFRKEGVEIPVPQRLVYLKKR